jgi:hypothetical protein
MSRSPLNVNELTGSRCQAPDVVSRHEAASVSNTLTRHRARLPHATATHATPSVRFARRDEPEPEREPAPAPLSPRYRDLGLTIGLLPPGAGNAITDVEGVQVGAVTLIEGVKP